MINYNELYETLRKEKYSDNLQALPKDFLKDVGAFLSEKKKESLGDDDLLGGFDKGKKQFENSVSLFKELMRNRKKKLLNLVFVATEMGIMKRDFENMLEFERDLFEKLVDCFEENNKNLSDVLSGSATAEESEDESMRLILFNQAVEQFVDHNGENVGPFSSGELANLSGEVAKILVEGGKATYVDE